MRTRSGSAEMDDIRISVPGVRCTQRDRYLLSLAFRWIMIVTVTFGLKNTLHALLVYMAKILLNLISLCSSMTSHYLVVHLLIMNRKAYFGSFKTPLIGGPSVAFVSSLGSTTLYYFL